MVTVIPVDLDIAIVTIDIIIITIKKKLSTLRSPSLVVDPLNIDLSVTSNDLASPPPPFTIEVTFLRLVEFP